MHCYSVWACMSNSYMSSYYEFSTGSFLEVLALLFLYELTAPVLLVSIFYFWSPMYFLFNNPYFLLDIIYLSLNASGHNYTILSATFSTIGKLEWSFYLIITAVAGISAVFKRLKTSEHSVIN